MADSSRRGTELLEQGAERFLCFCRGHDSGGSIPYRGQNCKVLRPGSVGFPEDGGDFLRGMVEHIERFGEHHAGNAEGVANFSKNNGIAEGFHRKMKLIQRRAYGYRNFQNYRLRVLVECGHIQI